MSEFPEIVTEGTGHHEEIADRAELGLSFSAKGRTRAAAVTELGKLVAAAQRALDSPAVTVAHRRLWVHDEWKRGSRTGTCRASEQLTLRVTDLAELETVLGALLAAEPSGLTGPTWLLDDTDAAVLVAQRNAVADARRRAEGYAAALGGRLGPLRRLTESDGRGARPMFAMRAAGVEGAPDVDVRDLELEPEPVRVTVQCTTTWGLELEG
ncbi:MAG: SIMPL domain-containing protein [Pseudonocardia sp.]|nr:SIMPL domain-containing protein [Pseudonocardia sp.]